IDLAGRAFTRADLHLAVTAATGSVTGVVRNQNGTTIPGAAVVAVGTESRVDADGAGGFALRDVAAGSRIVEARAIGYPPARVPGVQLRPNGSSYLVELQRGQGQITNRELANYCPPSYFIDGVYFPLPPVETPSVPVAPEEILAIEIYANLFSAPLQYQRLNSG